MKHLIDQINAAGISSPHFIEDEIDMTGVTVVDKSIDLDEHRWYVLGTVVYTVGGEFFGVRGPVSLKSEMMNYDDVGHPCEAFPMEQIPSVTYRRKAE